MHLSDDAKRVLVYIRKLHYDDALYGIDIGNNSLVLSPYRLEYLLLDMGLPNYRLYHRTKLIGVARVRHANKLDVVQKHLAVHLVSIGFAPMTVRVIRYGAVTPMDAPTHRLPYLFEDVH